MDSFDIPMPPEIRQFLEDMLKDADAMPEAEELKEMMLSDLYTRLQAKLFLLLADKLEEDQLETYSRLSTLDPAQGNAYLDDVLPNYRQLFLQTLAEFRGVFLGKK